MLIFSIMASKWLILFSYIQKRSCYHYFCLKIMHIPFRHLLSVIFQVMLSSKHWLRQIGFHEIKVFAVYVKPYFFPILWNDGRKNLIEEKVETKSEILTKLSKPFGVYKDFIATSIKIFIFACCGMRNCGYKRKNYALIAYYYFGRYYLPW